MYQIVGQTVIFNWDFNQVLNDAILNDIKSCNKIIFSNYGDLDTCLITDNEYDCEYYNRRKLSKFNHPLDNLPSEIGDLTLSYHFNQCLDNLPNNITKITFKSYEDYNIRFNQEIKKIPPNLKIIDISRIENKSHLKKEFKKFNIEIIE